MTLGVHNIHWVAHTTAHYLFKRYIEQLLERYARHSRLGCSLDEKLLPARVPQTTHYLTAGSGLFLSFTLHCLSLAQPAGEIKNIRQDRCVPLCECVPRTRVLPYCDCQPDVYIY
jgi:hypothetical protein